MKQEVFEIPGSDGGEFLAARSAVQGAGDIALDVIDKAIADISYISGGTAVGLTNLTGKELVRKRVLWWKQRAQQLGSFGNLTPAKKVAEGETTAYDINFSIPVYPFRAGGAYSMVVYEGSSFDLLIGVRIWYQFLDAGSLWWPYLLAQLGKKGVYQKYSEEDLYAVLKNQSRKQSMQSQMKGFGAEAQGGAVGVHTYVSNVTVWSSK